MRKPFVLCAVLFLAASGQAVAQLENFQPLPELITEDSALTLRVGAEHTDNAARTENGAQSDVLATAGLGGNYRRNGRKLDIRSQADIDYVRYLDNTFGTNIEGYADLNALWGSPEDLFQFMVRDRFTQLRDNPLASATPVNLENINTLTAGPAFNIGFSPKMHLTVFGLYTITDYERAELSSDTTLVGAALVRALSADSSISLNADTQSIEYDNPLAAVDYDQKQAYVRYSRSGMRSTLATDLGYSVIEQQGDSTGGLLLRLDFSRRVSGFSTIHFNASQQYTAANQTTAVELPIGADGGAIVSGDPFQEKALRLDWTTARVRTRFNVGAFWQEEQHQNQPTFDRKYYGINAGFTRNLRPTLILRLFGSLQKEKYESLGSDFDTKSFTADLQNNMGRRLGISLRYERYDRSGSQSIFGYTENRYGVRLTYLLHEGR